MTHATIQSVRELISLSRLGSKHLGEDVSNLDSLLGLSDNELAETLTVEDMELIYSDIPAYFRGAVVA